MRRRVAFATPFVVIVGCSKPAPEPMEPTRNPPAPPLVDAGVPADASTPLDAAFVGEKARIIAVGLVDGDRVVTIGAGSAKGVTKDSKICVLDAKDEARCLAGGELEVIEVKANVTKARTRLPMDVLKANPRVLVR